MTIFPGPGIKQGIFERALVLVGERPSRILPPARRGDVRFGSKTDCVDFFWLSSDGGPVRFDFTGVEADTHAFDGRCGRLLSFYVSYKSNSKTLRVGNQQAPQA